MQMFFDFFTKNIVTDHISKAIGTKPVLTAKVAKSR
jgi:hypothetical protein